MRLLTTIQTFKRQVNTAVVIGLIALCLCTAGGVANAQSTDIASPTAVYSNEVLGTIAARDIGDPRVTDHFYAFTGTPGDLLITVEGRNLNGDIDVFTSTSLRPLLKFTVYAGSSSPVTKSIYLRTRESLILRIEGRTPNDDDATYRLHFGGAFEPIIGGPDIAATEPSAPDAVTAAVRSSLKKGRRVSSVGARIPEPPPDEVAAAATPEPPPLEWPTPEEAKPEAPKAEVGRAPVRSGRGRVGRRGREDTPSENVEAEPIPAPTRRRGAGRRTARGVIKPPATQEPESGPRLVIETSDGTMINRYMSTVRRVIVENGQVVVVGRDGKIDRIQLMNIVRMSISPE